MTRGTTPTFILSVPESIDLSGAAYIYAAFAQGGETLVKTGPDLFVDGNVVEVYLSEEETLLFTDGEPMEIQLNWVAADGSRACTRIERAPVRRNMIPRVLGTTGGGVKRGGNAYFGVTEPDPALGRELDIYLRLGYAAEAPFTADPEYCVTSPDTVMASGIQPKSSGGLIYAFKKQVSGLAVAVLDLLWISTGGYHYSPVILSTTAANANYLAGGIVVFQGRGPYEIDGVKWYVASVDNFLIRPETLVSNIPILDDYSWNDHTPEEMIRKVLAMAHVRMLEEEPTPATAPVEQYYIKRNGVWTAA